MLSTSLSENWSYEADFSVIFFVKAGLGMISSSSSNLCEYSVHGLPELFVLFVAFILLIKSICWLALVSYSFSCLTCFFKSVITLDLGSSFI